MIDQGRLLATFLALVRIESPSGREDELAHHLMGALSDLGLEATRDGAGNVLGRWDGRGRGAPFLLGAHMDTVTPCENVAPVVEGGIVRAGGDTILGADDKSGIAQILEMIAVVEERGLSHPPIEALFTAGEEVGLRGAKGLNIGELRASWAVILDHDQIDEIVVCAPSHDQLRAVVHGKAAHAGAKPEDGVNAILIAAEAVAAMPLGRIDAQTTANVGMIQGGGATNVVPALVELSGEARSRSEAKLSEQIDAMRRALEEAAGATAGGSRSTWSAATRATGGAPTTRRFESSAARSGPWALPPRRPRAAGEPTPTS